MSKNKKDFGNMKILADLPDFADDCVAISWKTKFWKFKIQKKTLTDLADLADDCVAINWKTKIWKLKIQKKLSQI